MNCERLWKCPECEYSETFDYDWLAEHGGPVCPKCDCDMELQPQPAPEPRQLPLTHRDAHFDAVPDRQTRTISFILATFKETDAENDVDRSKTAEVVVEQTPCHLRIILDPHGEEHDLLIEQRADRWAIFAHVPCGGDPLCIIETNDRRAVVLDGDDGRELLARQIEEDPYGHSPK
jgi:hypothetical protein